ncbi:MAG: phosphoribosyltransferase [Nocardioidaceae bacterium]|nr:phosphoribosyltransferase [Nocardioidaceae bacterium]MDQ3165505.1 phosphoribosyltransferase [Actinomycetota bacterium]
MSNQPHDAARLVLDHLRWVDGHADVWRLFLDAEALQAVVHELVVPWRRRGITKLCGIESRGFLLGGAAAVALGVGFIAVRKTDGLLPGVKITELAEMDYRGRRHQLRMQRGALHPSDRVLLVDDWAEKGSQALAARRLVERCGADFAGVSVIVNQLAPDVEFRLAPVTHLVRGADLGQG